MIVLDTCSILWDALEKGRITRKARHTIEHENDSGLIFCEISFWEIAMLMQKQRLKVDCSYSHLINLILRSRNYILQGITPDIADRSTHLPETVSSDPADRMIVATALCMNLKLITGDTNLIASRVVPVVW